MTGILEKIYTAGFSVYLHGFGAVDSWIDSASKPATRSHKQRLCDRTNGQAGVQILTNAGTPDLARLFESLRYPGVNLADAALDTKDCTLYFHCADSINDDHPSFNLLQFYQDCKTRTFYDPHGIYPLLAGIRRSLNGSRKVNKAAVTLNPVEIFKQGLNPGFERSRALMDAALILARYFPPDSEAEHQIKEISGLFDGLHKGAPPGQEEQRVLLSALMTSINPGLGLELLKACGFTGEYWHELAILDEADHSKEFHPEGNAWEHTMETFRHRKAAYDLRLSLGLLLHDTGKPIAVSADNRRFYGHAKLGEIQARKFLERLGFSASLISDVCFLVNNHMITAALPRLPFFRTAEIMESPLFPLLLELYRCDESSSYKGLDGYYESSAMYQSYLRNRRNPYRSADGKKLNRKQMSEASYSQR